MAGDRQTELLMLLLEQGETTVQAIANALGASLATVRRDLIELEQSGRIERSHGSARISQGARKEVQFSSREVQNIEAKRVIAALAAKLIKPNDVLFLDASTTVLQLARHIKNLDMKLKVFTNGIVVAQELIDVPNIELTVVGGRLRPENLSMVGPFAISMINSLWFDRLFLGATAIDDEANLTSLDADESAINAAMISRSSSVAVMADSSKIGKRATYFVDQLKSGQILITDQKPEDGLLEIANDCGLLVEHGNTQTSDLRENV